MSGERVNPVSPRDLAKKKLEVFPNEVIESFNELIARNSGDGLIIVDQDEVVELMVEKGLDQNQIYKKGWLNVEDVYRQAGWRVEYDKPGYNETYSPHFIFSRLRQKARY